MSKIERNICVKSVCTNLQFVQATLKVWTGLKMYAKPFYDKIFMSRFSICKFVAAIYDGRNVREDIL